MVDKSDIKDHFDKYVLFCREEAVHFQQGSKITKENILHVVYFGSEFLQIRMGQHF
jgi:hypothetical protein